jgi:YidC/Oxa1 family membrane protein insertase
MDNARFVLIVFFFFLSIMLYQQWQVDYGPKPAVSSSQAGVSPAANPDVPVSADAAGSPESTSAQTENLISRQRILVKTDVVRMEIDTEGGDIRLLELLDYPVAKDAPNSPVQLFTDKDLVFVAQTGSSAMRRPHLTTIVSGRPKRPRLPWPKVRMNYVFP